MKKRMTALFLTLCLCLGLLAGCGTGPKPVAPEDEQTAQPAEKPAEVPAEQNEEAPADGPVTVTIFHHIGEQAAREGLEAVCAALEEKNPNVHYELQGLEFSQFDTMLKTKLVGGDAPDVVMGNPKMYKELIEAGHFYDLTNEPMLESRDPAVIEGVKVNDKIYSIPYTVGGMGVYYNRQVFADLGLEIPKTHSELMAAAQTIADAGLIPFARGFQDGWTAQVDTQADLYGTFLSENPDFYAEIIAGNKKFADYPGFRDCMQRNADRLSFDGGDAFGTDAAKARGMLMNGEAAMFLGGDWDAAEFIKLGYGDKLGFFPCPGNEEGEPILGLTYGGCYMVTEASEHKKEACEFLDFLTSSEGIKITSNFAPYVPVGVSAEESKDFAPLLQDWMRPVQEGRFHDSYAREIFSGQRDATFRTWQEEFAADEERDVDALIAVLDQRFEAIE